tara:strand:- start:1282 stop:1485 length:204 start_codon:yes stop_codon:yes gene_type:complete
MLSYILIGAVILIGLYFYMQKSHHVEKDNNVPPTKSNFYPSDKFDGAMAGYVFKMDESGLGYYLDTI